MIDKNVFYGADRVQTLVGTPDVSDTFQGASSSVAAPTNLHAGIARVWMITVTGDVVLPAANGNELKVGRVGGPTFVVINISGGAVDVKDAGGNVIKNVGDDEALVICLADNSTSNGTWFKHLMQVA